MIDIPVDSDRPPPRSGPTLPVSARQNDAHASLPGPDRGLKVASGPSPLGDPQAKGIENGNRRKDPRSSQRLRRPVAEVEVHSRPLVPQAMDALNVLCITPGA